MSDEGAIQIIEWACISESLKTLDLSDNKLTDNISPSLTKLVSTNLTFEELYLCWNNISSVGADPFFKALIKNEGLRVLDLGWNTLGSNMKVIKKNAASFTETLSQFLQTNKTMFHLSFNNNGFSYEESQKIAEVHSINSGSQSKQNTLWIPLFWQLRLCRLPRLSTVRR